MVRRQRGRRGRNNHTDSRLNRHRCLRLFRGVRLRSDRNRDRVWTWRCRCRGVCRRLRCHHGQRPTGTAAAARAAQRPSKRSAGIGTGYGCERCDNRCGTSSWDARWRGELQRKTAGDGHCRGNLFRRIGDALRRQRRACGRRKSLRRGVMPARVHCSAPAGARRAREAPAHCCIGMPVACYRGLKRLGRA